jgi:hypothetical protein
VESNGNGDDDDSLDFMRDITDDRNCVVRENHFA